MHSFLSFLNICSTIERMFADCAEYLLTGGQGIRTAPVNLPNQSAKC